MPPRVEEATRRELSAAGQVDSWRGALALLLARRIDAGRDEGDDLAALHDALTDTLAAALRPVDELRARRARRGY